MKHDIGDQVKQTFYLLTLQHLAKHHLTDKQWHEVQQIRERYQKENENAKARFQETYERDVRTRQRELIAKAGQKDRQYKHPRFGSDPFDKDRITHEAQRFVRSQHHEHLNHLEKSEIQDIETLMERADKNGTLRSEFQDKADRPMRQEFQRSTTPARPMVMARSR